MLQKSFHIFGAPILFSPFVPYFSGDISNLNMISSKTLKLALQDNNCLIECNTGFRSRPILPGGSGSLGYGSRTFGYNPTQTYNKICIL